MVTNLDGTELKGDATLTPETEQTPQDTKPEVETYTREQVDKAVRDARSAVLADAGRYKAEAEKALRAATAAEERVNRLIKEQAQMEIDSAKDDPERMNLITERQKRRELEVKLETAQQELTNKSELVKTFESREVEITKSQKAAEIAIQYKVDPGILLSVTDGSAEKMEALAKILPKTSEAKKPLKTDSGNMIGGKLTWEQVRDEFIKNPRGAYREQYLEMKKKRGNTS